MTKCVFDHARNQSRNSELLPKGLLKLAAFSNLGKNGTGKMVKEKMAPVKMAKEKMAPVQMATEKMAPIKIATEKWHW